MISSLKKFGKLSRRMRSLSRKAFEFPHSSLVFNSGFSSLMSIASVTCLSSFQDIHKKTKYWFTRKQKGCVIIFWSVIELGNVHCTGVNSGKEEKETRGTLTNGIIGTKEEVMKQLCSWRQHPMDS